MNYEFHVGDYVETVGGAKGYICDANKDWWYCTNADDEYSVGYVYRIVRLGRGGIHECYNRIGTYDFTKKEKKKIVPISDCNKHIFANAIKSDNHLVRVVSDDILNKINELVDVVNKLMDKEDKNDKTTM